nr:MAG TPA: hypothetical protein [Caudoviricetes sp.]
MFLKLPFISPFIPACGAYAPHAICVLTLRKSCNAELGSDGNADGKTLTVHVLTRKVGVLALVVFDEQAVPDVHYFDRAIVSSNYPHLVVVESEGVGAGLVSLLHAEDVASIPTAIIPKFVHVVLVVVAGILSNGQLAESGLCTDYSCSLAGRSLNVLYESKQLVLTVCTGNDVGRVKSFSSGGQTVDGIVSKLVDMVLVRLCNAVNEFVEVNAACKKSAEVLVNADDLHDRGDSHSLTAGDSLATNALNAISGSRNYKVGIALDVELRGVTILEVTVLNEVEEGVVFSLDALFDGNRDDLLNELIEVAAGTEGLGVELCGAAVHLDKSSTELFGSLRLAVLCVSLVLYSVDSDREYIVSFHSFISPFDVLSVNADNVPSGSAILLNCHALTDSGGAGSGGRNSFELGRCLKLEDGALRNRQRFGGVESVGSDRELVTGVKYVGSHDIARLVGEPTDGVVLLGDINFLRSDDSDSTELTGCGGSCIGSYFALAIEKSADGYDIAVINVGSSLKAYKELAQLGASHIVRTEHCMCHIGFSPFL